MYINLSIDNIVPEMTVSFSQCVYASTIDMTFYELQTVIALLSSGKLFPHFYLTQWSSYLSVYM